MSKISKKSSPSKRHFLDIRTKRKRLFFKIVVFSILLLSVIKLMPKGSIGGHITQDGKPVSGRTVLLAVGENRNKIGSTHTNAEGYYRFSLLKPALYFVEKEDAKGDSSYSISYDKRGKQSIGYTEISFNFKKQTTGLYLGKNQVINNLDYDVDWPSNYQDFPAKYTYTIDQYIGMPIQAPQPTTLPTPTMTVPKSLENGIVVIPELGIKMQITDDIKDLIYNVYYKDKNSISITFSTQRIIELDKGCIPLNNPVGGLRRTSSYHPLGENVGVARKVGNYYYAITTPQAYCASDSSKSAVGPLIGNLRMSLQNSYRTLQAL